MSPPSHYYCILFIAACNYQLARFRSHSSISLDYIAAALSYTYLYTNPNSRETFTPNPSCQSPSSSHLMDKGILQSLSVGITKYKFLNEMLLLFHLLSGEIQLWDSYNSDLESVWNARSRICRECPDSAKLDINKSVNLSEIRHNTLGFKIMIFFTLNIRHELPVTIRTCYALNLDWRSS